ncbi:MAG: hypothetical protein ACE5ID_10350 [Acidobacteriota bacterium]
MLDHGRSESGEGKAGFIFSLALLGIIIWGAVVLVPIKIQSYEFYDEMKEEARFGAIYRKRVDIVHDRLIKKAKQLGIPLDPRDLKIEQDGNLFVITAEYAVPVDFTIYKTTWTYTPRATAPMF